MAKFWHHETAVQSGGLQQPDFAGFLWAMSGGVSDAARAELESRHGYDTKHAMHLVRLMRMGLEILQTGELRVRRPDAEELNAIRDGALTYDELIETAMDLQSKMEGAAGSSRLPADVDYGRGIGWCSSWLGHAVRILLVGAASLRCQ